MKLRDVTVATITRVRGQADEKLILRALSHLTDRALPIALSDRGSSRRFVNRVRGLPSVTLVPPREDGLVGQVQASFAEACRAGSRFVLYTEPDKDWFFDGPVFDFIARADDHAGIVLAARSPAGFKTFPPFQQLAESSASELCRQLTGVKADFFYGPFLVTRELAGHVAHAPGTLGWGWRPFLFLAAHRLGYRLASVAGPYRCPEAQRIEDERDKRYRMRQLVDNASGLIAALGSQQVIRSGRSVEAGPIRGARDASDRHSATRDHAVDGE